MIKLNYYWIYFWRKWPFRNSYCEISSM